MALITEPNLADPDAAYRLIVEAHRDLTEAQCHQLGAALVLILANHVGDARVIGEAIALARQAIGAAAPVGPDATPRQVSDIMSDT